MAEGVWIKTPGPGRPDSLRLRHDGSINTPRDKIRFRSRLRRLIHRPEKEIHLCGCFPQVIFAILSIQHWFRHPAHRHSSRQTTAQLLSYNGRDDFPRPRHGGGGRCRAHSTDHSQTASKQKQEDVESTPSGAEEYKHEYPEGFRLTLILTAVVLAYLLVYLDLAIMSTATPSITSNFDSLVDIGWYGGAYQLASAVERQDLQLLFHQGKPRSHAHPRPAHGQSNLTPRIPVVLSHLLHDLRDWISALRSGPVVVHVHRGPGHRGPRVFRHCNWCPDHHRRRSPNPETATLHGSEHGHRPIGPCMRSHYRRRF